MSLYKSASGREVNHVSYSAISEYTFCRRLFYLSRIAGYKDKDKRAAFEFGKCIEEAIQFFHTNGSKHGDTTDEFKRLWLKWREIPLVFTSQEGSWADLYKTGSELTRLYEVMLPSLPIRNPKFQINYEKELWPNTDLAGLNFTSFVDMLVTRGDGSRILIDIKTAKGTLDLTQNLLAMDPQLKDYAWATGIREVGFLWLVKARPDSFKKGDSVTLLEDTLEWKAGQSLSVYKFIEAPVSDPAEESKIVVGTEESVRELDEMCETIKGKGSTEAKAQTFSNFLSEGKMAVLKRESITKTRLQFVTATIPEKNLPEIGQDVGGVTLRIRQSAIENFWPQDGGVRYPNQKCAGCRMRGICLEMPVLADQMLVRITPAAKEDDWLSELESGAEE